MARIEIVTKETLEKYGENVASVSGQYVGTGNCITMTIIEYKSRYYLVMDIEDEERDRLFCEEEGYEDDYVDITIDDCKSFGVKFLGYDPDDVINCANDYVKENLDYGQKFYYDDLMGICGC